MMTINGPFTLTGELQRNYNFEALLVKDLSLIPTGLDSDLIALLKQVYSQATLIYVSGLIKKITPPTEGLAVKELALGALGTISMPTAVTISPFSVVFQNDDLGTVQSFWKAYYRSVTGNRNMTVEALKYLTFGLMFSRTMNSGVSLLKEIDTVIKIPSTFEYYPRVIPILTSESEYDKSGDSLTETTVTFIRIPKLVRKFTAKTNSSLLGG